MKKIILFTLVACFSMLVMAGEPASDPELTVPRIIEKNVAARGGLEAWRKIETMVWNGHIESANAPTQSLPFLLEMKRPDKTRFEIKTQSQSSVRMFDGIHGWKLRPTGQGTPDVQPYTADEIKFARDGQGIDGLLIDYQVKGIAVTLDGVDDVEGRKAYRLNIRLPSGNIRHAWIDEQSFLDIKYDRQSRNTFGQPATVTVFNRNFQTIEGVQLPLTIESGTDAGKLTDKMVIDRISLNSPLADRMFTKPIVQARSKAAMVNIDPSELSHLLTQSELSVKPRFPKLSTGPMPATGSAQ